VELTLDCSADANESAPRCLRLAALTQLTRLTLRGHGSHRLITYEENPKVEFFVGHEFRLEAKKQATACITVWLAGPSRGLGKGSVQLTEK